MNDTAGIITPDESAERGRWLLLIHQVPPKPDYLRVKVRRRLERMGAVALKNSVYVLPRNESSTEDFQWLLGEIVAEGGESSLCEAVFLEGVSDDELVRTFQAARGADYMGIAAAADRIGVPGDAPPPDGEPVGHPGAGQVARLRRRLEEVASIDFFDAPERGRAAAAIDAAETRIRLRAVGIGTPPASAGGPTGTELFRSRTWVTRRGVHVDRIASAWLIRRFIDRAATFKFVAAKGYRPKPRELRFDMYDAEFTHEGNRCTFETLLARFDLRDSALHVIGAIVHDIDLKEARFGRPETPGLAAVIDGISLAHDDDVTRLERGALVLDDLYHALRRRLGVGDDGG